MNMQNLMNQMQKMKKDVEKKQNEVEQMEFEGTSEWVDVKLNGKREILSFKIKQKSVEEDDIEILEDMLKIAFKDALTKIDKEYDKKLGMYGQGLSGLM